MVDAKTGVSGNWINSVEGPSGVDLVKAAADTAIDASVNTSFTAFDRTMGDWQGSLIKWRCGLSAADRAKFGARSGWNCHDLKFFVGRIGFDQLDPARAAELETIPTRFRLPPDQVDAVIAAGRDALRSNPAFRAFAGTMNTRSTALTAPDAAGSEPVLKYVQANGVRFAYLEQGEGPLVVFLHGFPDNAWSYRKQLQAFADAGYRAVAPFLRGYAPTEIPADGIFDPIALGKDLEALIEALSDDGQACVVGMDWRHVDLSGAGHGAIGDQGRRGHEHRAPDHGREPQERSRCRSIRLSCLFLYRRRVLTRP